MFGIIPSGKINNVFSIGLGSLISIKLIIVLESVFVTAISGHVGLLLGGVVLNSFDLEDYWITDPGVSTSLVIAATFTLILAGLIAAYVPANRAANIKPIVALRDE